MCANYDAQLSRITRPSVQALLDAATLRGQSPAAREAIKAAVCQIISGFRRGDQYEVPMPALLAVAIKPAP